MMTKPQQLAEKLKQYIPNGDGYNSKFANDLTEAVEYLSQDELIAAAPELLEALEAIIERWDTPLWKDVPHTGNYINAARLVVAKAKGE